MFVDGLRTIRGSMTREGLSAVKERGFFLIKKESRGNEVKGGGVRGMR